MIKTAKEIVEMGKNVRIVEAKVYNDESFTRAENLSERFIRHLLLEKNSD